jgi:hypothetical protein
MQQWLDSPRGKLATERRAARLKAKGVGVERAAKPAAAQAAAARQLEVARREEGLAQLRREVLVAKRELRNARAAARLGCFAG